MNGILKILWNTALFCLLFAILYLLFPKSSTQKSLFVLKNNEIALKQATTTMQTINFTTKDGIIIEGDWYETNANPPKGAIILLHMMPETKKSWSLFAQNASKDGWNALAIDLRGHGGSIKSSSGTINFLSFSDKEHQSSIEDVRSAIEFIKGKNIKTENIILVGASIGANLALEAQSENPLLKASVVLSAGTDYRGIKSEPLVKKLTPQQYVLFIGTEQDMRSSGQTASQMSELFAHMTPAHATLLSFKGEQHGTDILIAYPGLIDEIISWINRAHAE